MIYNSNNSMIFSAFSISNGRLTRLKLLVLVLLFASVNLGAQTNDADAILKKAKDKYALIKDYQADVTIKIDIDFVKIPIKKAKVYFKQPDKVKFETNGFIMMHKKAMNFSIDNFIKGNVTTLYVKQEVIDKYAVHKIKIIPNDENSDMIITSLWIDVATFAIRKVEHHSKTTGSFVMTMAYARTDFNLPDVMNIQFDAGKNALPIPFDDPAEKAKSMGKKKATKGGVTLTYRNFKVNQGVSDAIFLEKKKK
jgi:hypothetical protein